MDTINVILNHRSIRKFQQQAVTAEQDKTLVTAAQRAST